MSDFVDGPVRVRVPATSANLGPGFDSLGLALALHDEVVAEVTPADLTVDIEGEGADGVTRDESHLVVRAMRRTFTLLAAEPPGLSLTCRNAVPHARGLGSSAAAIVAGVLLARGLVAEGAARLDDEAALALAAEIEGHADNVAPCQRGGFTIAWHDGGSTSVIRRDVHPDVVPVVIVPPTGAATAVARGVLPATVPHADAAFTAGRAALLAVALTADPSLLLPATDDRLHQRYRAGVMPDTAALVAVLRATGLPAVVSGAGPTVLVLARAGAEADRALAAAPSGWRALRLDVDAHGATVSR